MAYTKHALSIAILSEYDRIKPRVANMHTILGNRDTRGSLEHTLNTTFSTEDRALAGRVINDLVDRAFLSPDYAQMMEPENWLSITALGEQSLRTGALDDLDNLLLATGSSVDLLQLRYGAYDAIVARNTDWERHAATSARELITKTLHVVSPDAAVRADTKFKEDTKVHGGITRAERIRHYLREKSVSPSKSDVKVGEKACDLIEACYTKLSAGTHADVDEIESLIKLTEDALYFLLK